MAMYVLRDVDPTVLREARTRAQDDGLSLADVLRRLLARYARSGDTLAAGGRARAAQRTSEPPMASAAARRREP